jgi:hypothetical protein
MQYEPFVAAMNCLPRDIAVACCAAYQRIDPGSKTQTGRRQKTSFSPLHPLQ